ncbi:MAG: hypothetical protein M3282_13315 [Gemmatimonadota bacterium]|nr:hypothetical protein [Gemmatimonadota bacterium]
MLPRLASLCTLPLAVQAAQPAAAEHTGESGEGCTVREVSRSRLVVEDGRELYVEPVAFAVSGREILLAGTPTFLWRRRSPGRPAVELTRDSVFGAVIRRDGRARIVPSPVDAKLITDVRVLGRGDGTWEAVFAELEAPKAEPADEGAVARYWYGVFDGRAWSRLEELPRPEGARPRLLSSVPSPLVRLGDTLWLTTPVTTNGGESEVVVYSRREGRWTYELVPTYFAAYAVLAPSDSLGLVLLVVRGDRAVSWDENSLFMFARRPGWQMVRKVIPGGDEPVHGPSLVASSAGRILAWSSLVRDPQDPRGARLEARAMVGWSEARTEPVVTVDSSSAPVPRIVVTSDGAPIWVTQHSTGAGDELELRFVHPVAGRASVLARLPNPFQGYHNAASLAPRGLVIAGPELNRSVDQPALVTLLLRARVQCLRGRIGRASR